MNGQRHDSPEPDEGFDKSFVEFAEKNKIFNDMVHTNMELPSICSRLINTPQFQRLRNLKQLGLCYYVYPTAAHNRFEHCIGTSYLAGMYGKSLRKNQPELNISDEDILCLYLAGLLHDIGHGPFSHTWERFMHAITGNEEYSHEMMSLKLIDYLIEDNDLKKEFEAINLHDEDIVFIKELILGHPLSKNKEFQGRSPCKQFLYQIVSNSQTKIDVDKFDYLLRDCKQLNVSTVFDYQRLMDNSKVVGFKDGVICDRIEQDTPTIIVYRKKVSGTIEDLFRSRFSMHQKAYQHRVTRVIEEMVLDGLKAAEPHFKVPGANGRMYKLSEVWQDPCAFIKLTDSIFERILHWNCGGLKAAKIFQKVVKRNLYDFLGSFSRSKDVNLEELQKKDSNIRFITTKINYGGGANNPLNEVLFYEKVRPNHLIRVSYPDQPEERRTFIIYSSAEDCGDNGADSNHKCHDVSIHRAVRLERVKKEVRNWADEQGIKLDYE